MHASYTSSVNRVASFRLARVATFPSSGRLIYAILPTIECCKQFSSVGECLGAPEYNKKRFSSKRKSTEIIHFSLFISEATSLFIKKITPSVNRIANFGSLGLPPSSGGRLINSLLLASVRSVTDIPIGFP